MPASDGGRTAADPGQAVAAELVFDADDARYLRELGGYVAVPGVSRDASPDTMAAAQWLAKQLAFAHARLVPTRGHPVVRGEWPGAAGVLEQLVMEWADADA